MKWGTLKAYYPDAVDDLCDFVAEKYGGKGTFQFFFKNSDILIIGKELGRISHEDMLDWMSLRWKIYLNVNTSVTKTEVRFDYWMSYIQDGELWKTPLEHGFETFNEVVDHCVNQGIRAIHKRIKPKD